MPWKIEGGHFRDASPKGAKLASRGLMCTFRRLPFAKIDYGNGFAGLNSH